jgi:hypothetical protein
MNEELKRIKEKYKERGRGRYTLSSVEDLKAIHGVDIEKISGFEKFEPKVQEMLKKFLVNYYNAWGIEARMGLRPLYFESFMGKVKFTLIEQNKRQFYVVSGPSRWA